MQFETAGNALIAISDTLLSEFPNLRNRFRNAIKEKVDNAVAKVNQLAENLKSSVKDFLDSLGKALDKALNLLEAGLMSAIKVVGDVVQSAIKFAQAIVQAYAAFAMLIKDIAADPGQWIRNFALSVIDGIKNHLVCALKVAIKKWFNEKVESILGLGRMIYQLFVNGGITMEKVAQLAWNGIKSAIPGVLIKILIEKLVAMIVPAAGAILAIIERGTSSMGRISKIISAFQLFWTFLKAVKTGNAGMQFAAAVHFSSSSSD